MDAGELEADIAFSAGADLVTVLGSAGDSTILGAVTAAKKHGKGVVVDLIGAADKPARAREVIALGVEFVEMHAGLDDERPRTRAVASRSVLKTTLVHRVGGKSHVAADGVIPRCERLRSSDRCAGGDT